MASIDQDREKLISDLLDEAHGLRMKYEDFSQFTESKIANYVLAMKPQTLLLEQTRKDLAVVRAQRAQIQQELIIANTLVAKLTKQRDSARLRIEALEASRPFRIAKKLRKLAPRVLRGS